MSDAVETVLPLKTPLPTSANGTVAGQYESAINTLMPYRVSDIRVHEASGRFNMTIDAIQNKYAPAIEFAAKSDEAGAAEAKRFIKAIEAHLKRNATKVDIVRGSPSNRYLVTFEQFTI